MTWKLWLLRVTMEIALKLIQPKLEIQTASFTTLHYCPIRTPHKAVVDNAACFLAGAALSSAARERRCKIQYLRKRE
jgi:cbb3-type cytochrome oxidase subunit 1